MPEINIRCSLNIRTIQYGRISKEKHNIFLVPKVVTRSLGLWHDDLWNEVSVQWMFISGFKQSPFKLKSVCIHCPVAVQALKELYELASVKFFWSTLGSVRLRDELSGVQTPCWTQSFQWCLLSHSHSSVFWDTPLLLLLLMSDVPTSVLCLPLFHGCL